MVIENFLAKRLESIQGAAHGRLRAFDRLVHLGRRRALAEQQNGPASQRVDTRLRPTQPLS